MDEQTEDAAIGSRSLTRLWLLRALAFFGGTGSILLLMLYSSNHDVPMVPLLSAETVLLLLAVAIAVYAEVTFRDHGMSTPDALLVHRLKTSSARHLVWLAFTMPLALGLFWICRYTWHLSMLETLMLVTLPSIAVAGCMQVLWPITAGSDVETVRANLLMLDRMRRQQAFGYALFTGLLGINIMLIIPQLQHALRGQPIRLDNFDVLALGGFLSLYILAQPARWFERASVRHVTEDESLTRFRQLAFRNGFYVMALGMVLICDAVSSPPRLAIVLVPLVLSVSLMVTLLTLVYLEYRAGTFAPDAEDSPAPHRMNDTP
jgi:hypothetical protein